VFLTPDPLGLEGSLYDVGFVPNATLYLDRSGSSSSWPATTTRSSRGLHALAGHGQRIVHYQTSRPRASPATITSS